MSDAREIVQPRWKRRATEIAEAIGGNSAGVSSVSLDSNTITQLSQAIADAIDLKVLDINIKAYDDGLVSSAGLPIRTGTGPVSGGFLPLRVVTDIGDKVDINVREFNDVSVDSRGLPVQAGRTTSTNALVPLVVNCPTVNNFPSGGGGTGGGLNITDTTTAFKNALYGSGVAAANANIIHSVEVGTSNAINTTLRNPNFPLGVDITNSSLNVTGAAVTFPSTMAVTLPVDANNVTIPLATTETNPLTTLPVTLPVDANNVTIPLATTETAPVTTVSVDNHPTSTTITGTVSVTETNPVSGGGGGGGTSLTQQQVETAMGNALANATGISVTESAPVTAVKITGDETYGIIMTKIAQTSASHLDQYASVDYGTVGRSTNLQSDLLVSNGDNLNTGWIIRCNGQDIYNQDITLGIVDYGGTPGIYNLNLIQIPFTTSSVNGQPTVDKYYGRRVTLSSVANVWIVEPIPDVDVQSIGNVNVRLSGNTLQSEVSPGTWSDIKLLTETEVTKIFGKTMRISGGKLQFQEWNGIWYNMQVDTF